MNIASKSKLGIMVFVMTLFTINLSAQRPGGGQRPGSGPGGQGRGLRMSEEDIERRVDNLAKTLELTEDQHKKILDHELEFYTKMQIAREKNSGNREAMRASMIKARESRDKNYEEVLSADQFKKYKEIEQERINQRRQQNQNRDPQDRSNRPEKGRGRN